MIIENDEIENKLDTIQAKFNTGFQTMKGIVEGGFKNYGEAIAACQAEIDTLKTELITLKSGQSFSSQAVQPPNQSVTPSIAPGASSLEIAAAKKAFDIVQKFEILEKAIITKPVILTPIVEYARFLLHVTTMALGKKAKTIDEISTFLIDEYGKRSVTYLEVTSKALKSLYIPTLEAVIDQLVKKIKSSKSTAALTSDTEDPLSTVTDANASDAAIEEDSTDDDDDDDDATVDAKTP